MLGKAVNGLGLVITDQLSGNECSAMNMSSMTEKTVMLLDDSGFVRSVMNRLSALPTSFLCRIESVGTYEDKLLLVSSDTGKPVGKCSIYDAHAACCAALVLKECGAVHSNLLGSVRRNGDKLRVFGLDKLEPYSADGEKAEIRAVQEVGHIVGDTLEELRERLSVYINRWEMVHRKSAEAEKVKDMLMAQESFRSEWQSIEYLNAGAYGFIFRAISAHDGGEYALKVMNVGDDKDRLWKAKRESTNASQFYMNDNIVKTYDDGKVTAGQDKYIWISMELLEPIPNEISDEITVARIAGDVCRALEEIHKNGGMAHRDVKPGNILRGKDNWKLCDFGITKEVQGRDMATVIGTSEYMAPELLRAAAANIGKASYDNTVDIYALGMTMYILLNRGTAPFLSAPPYMADAREKKNADVLRLQGKELPKPVNCSDRLMKIIAKACSAKPSERYASVSRMYDALENFLEDC